MIDRHSKSNSIAKSVRSSHHGAHIQGVAGIREDDRFDLIRRESGAHGHREKIDLLFGTGSCHVRTQNLAGTLLEQNLVRGVPFADAQGRIPVNAARSTAPRLGGASFGAAFIPIRIRRQ